MKITKASGLSGEVMIPGDKSISHRAVMFGALGEGLTEVTHFLQGADCLSTIECFRRMGIAIRNEGDRVLVEGKGLHGLSAPSLTLDVGIHNRSFEEGVLRIEFYEQEACAGAVLLLKKYRYIVYEA